MDTVYCTQCGQLNVSNQVNCLYCDTQLPIFADSPVSDVAPPAPARPYFANDPSGPDYPSPVSPPPQPSYQPDYPAAPPERGYYAPPPNPYQMPTQTPPGYQGVDAFGLPSYSAYAPPTQQFTLASRGARLGATILDALAAFAIITVPAFIGALLDESMGSRGTFQPIFTVLGNITYFSILIYFLTVEGTTLGKKALGLRIVKEDTLENGGFVTNCIMRGLIPGILGAITCYIFALVDILFIFSQEQKCLHDQIAGTIVIEQAADYLKLN